MAFLLGVAVGFACSIVLAIAAISYVVDEA